MRGSSKPTLTLKGPTSTAPARSWAARSRSRVASTGTLPPRASPAHACSVTTSMTPATSVASPAPSKAPPRPRRAAAKTRTTTDHSPSRPLGSPPHRGQSELYDRRFALGDVLDLEERHRREPERAGDEAVGEALQRGVVLGDE